MEHFGDSLAISKTVVPMNVKFRRALKTSLNVLEMLSSLHIDYLVTIGDVFNPENCLKDNFVNFFERITLLL